jgi:hypothetical protein
MRDGGSCGLTGRPTEPDLGLSRVAAEDDDVTLFVGWPVFGPFSLGAVLGRPTEPERGFPRANPVTGAFVGWPPAAFGAWPRPNEPDLGFVAGAAVAAFSRKLGRGAEPEPDRGFVTEGFVGWVAVAVVCWACSLLFSVRAGSKARIAGLGGTSLFLCGRGTVGRGFGDAGAFAVGSCKVTLCLFLGSSCFPSCPILSFSFSFSTFSPVLKPMAWSSQVTFAD